MIMQGSTQREYVGFVCKEDSMQKLFCHMLKADDKKIVSNHFLLNYCYWTMFRLV